MSLYSISTDDAALVATTEKTFIRLNVGSGRKGILRELTVTDALAGATDQEVITHAAAQAVVCACRAAPHRALER